MLPCKKNAFLEELDATKESYVRKRLAFKGYPGWKKLVVQYWLEERSAKRQETAEKVRSFWLRMRVCVAVVGVFVTIALTFLPVI